MTREQSTELEKILSDPIVQDIEDPEERLEYAKAVLWARKRQKEREELLRRYPYLNPNFDWDRWIEDWWEEHGRLLHRRGKNDG